MKAAEPVIKGQGYHERLARARHVLVECNHALVHAASESDLLQQMCRIIVEVGGYCQCWIALAVDDAEKSIRTAAAAGYGDDPPHVEGMTWGPDGYQGAAGRVIASGETYITRDILHTETGRRRERALARNYQSSVSLPLFADRRCIGAVSIYAREAEAFDADEITVLSTLAQDISYGVDALRTRAARVRAEVSAHDSEQRFRAMFEQAAVGITRVDLDGVLVEVNQKFCNMLGYDREELLGKSVKDITHPDDYGRGAQHRTQLRRGDAKSLTGEKRFVRKDGAVVWARRTMSVARDETGNPQYIISIVEDITQHKAAEERLVYLAHHDDLTGLPNRALFRDRLEQTLAQAHRRNWLVGVMMLDLDRFKVTNDSLGHSLGDTLLKQVAERLRQCVRPGDTVGRFGGDEFGIILSDLGNGADARLVAQKVLEAFSAPFRLEDDEVYITASIGISMYPLDSDDLEALIKSADTALHRAKDAGRNNFQFYTAEMNARVRQRMSLENSLRRALDRDEFLLYFQPKASLSSGITTGVEALLRWQHPERGLMLPGEFVPVLEEAGMIIPVGEWVLGAACAQIKAWQAAGVPCAPVAVNLSGRQLLARGFGSRIRRLLDEHGTNPQLLELEITESSLMANTEDVIHTLEYLESIGIGISVDDFGTGYSSLSYLKRFPLDALKIDSSFVRDITTNAEDATIVRAIISMASSLGLKVVAEGVETEAQMNFLAANGCDEIQGYYLSRPMAVGQCSEWLMQRSHLSRPVVLRGSAPTVLLVDDEEDMLILLARALSQDGYRILTASSAEEGFKILSGNRIDVVVSDHQMPGMSGVEFLQQVKSLYPGAARIMCSALADFQVVSEAVNKGEIFRFVSKNASERRLRRDVRDALSARAGRYADGGGLSLGPGRGVA